MDLNTDEEEREGGREREGEKKEGETERELGSFWQLSVNGHNFDVC